MMKPILVILSSSKHLVVHPDAARHTRPPWKPHVVVDELLVTGQNPMSDHLFAECFMEVIG